MLFGCGSSFAQCQLGTGHLYLGGSNFDAPGFGIYIDTLSPNNQWQIGKPQKTFLNAAFSPNNALVTDTVNLPLPNDTSYATLVVPWDWAYTYIKFRHKFDIDSSHQQAYLECSYDHGLNWLLMDQFMDGNGLGCLDASERLWLDCDFDTTGLDQYPFTGTSDGWHQSGYFWQWYNVVRLDESDTLPPCVIPPDTLLVRFVFINDSVQSTHEGWMIDDLQVYQVEPGFGIDEVGAVDIALYPDPVTDEVTLTGDALPTHWWIRNLFGQRVAFVDDGSRNANVSELAPGYYIVEVETATGAVGRKAFVKQ